MGLQFDSRESGEDSHPNAEAIRLKLIGNTVIMT